MENVLIDKIIEIINSLENKVFKFSNCEIIKDWERNKIVRLNLKNDIDEISFIVKIIKDNDTCGFNDFAGLDFLSKLDLKSEIVPKFYFGDKTDKYFVMQDLQTNINLETYLNGNDYQSIKSYFVELAYQCSQLSLIAYNKQKEYENIRKTFPFTDRFGLEAESSKFMQNIEKVKSWFDALEIVIDDGFDKIINLINNKYANPEKFLSFSHGDMAPTNNLIKSEKVYLIDFEYCGYRHMLYDLTAWNILCPLPENIVRNMKNKFFESIENKLKINKEEFDIEWDYITLWRGLSIISWFPLQLIDKNLKWVDNFTMQEALLAVLKRMIIGLKELKGLEGLLESLIIMKKRLLEKWGYQDEEFLPKWNVFENNTIL